MRFQYMLFLLGTICLVYCKTDLDKNISEEKNNSAGEIVSIEDSIITASLPLMDSLSISGDSRKKSLDVKNSGEFKTVHSNNQNRLDTPSSSKATSIKSQSTEHSLRRAKIQFEELAWDFGQIYEGDIVEKKFYFTNTGNGPLQIFATSASCGCTRPSFPYLDIAPGESNSIGVRYNSVGKSGNQHPEVTIESNTQPRKTIIKLSVEVLPKRDILEKTRDIKIKKDSV